MPKVSEQSRLVLDEGGLLVVKELTPDTEESYTYTKRLLGRLKGQPVKLEIVSIPGAFTLRFKAKLKKAKKAKKAKAKKAKGKARK